MGSPYPFDDIGNRRTASRGGDQTGSNLRQANYTANNLNQYTQRTVPGYVDILGSANSNANVMVESVGEWYGLAYRKGEYFRAEVPLDNSSAAVWLAVTNIAVLPGGTSADIQTNSTGNASVPKTPESFSYDADGNLTNDGRWNYTWDAENRLVSMAASSGVGPLISLRFEYDSGGRRIRKQVWGNTTWYGSPTNDIKFIYDGCNPVAEVSTSNSALRTYMWGLDLSGSQQGGGGVGGLLGLSYFGSQASNCFVAFDGNGNVSALVKANDGTVSGSYEYGPFGELTRKTGLIATAAPLRFSSKYQDDETDLFYYGYRYYNPSTGMWNNRDPIEEDGNKNIYVFACNGPIGIVDELGLLDHKFEVTVGTDWAWPIHKGAGKWGQPWWCADGAYAILGSSAYSVVTVRSTKADSGSCNTVNRPDPSATIKLYLRDGCPGNFTITLDGAISLTGTGPRGQAAGALVTGYKHLVNSTGTTTSPTFEDGPWVFDAFVGADWTLVATWRPTISFGRDGGVRSSGKAYAKIEFVNATRF